MPVKTLMMGPGTLVIGEAGSTRAMESQVTNARVTPSVDTDDDTPVLSGDVLPGDRTESFSLAGTFVQDFGNADGLSEWTWTNRGDRLPFTFIPSTAAGRSLSGTVQVEATEIGGDVKTKPTVDFEWAAFDVELGAVGA